MPRVKVNPERLRAVTWDVLERLEELADRAGEVIGAAGLALLAAAVMLEGILELLAVVLAFIAAVLLAVLPRVREFLEGLRPRVLRWYLNRS